MYAWLRYCPPGVETMNEAADKVNKGGFYPETGQDKSYLRKLSYESFGRDPTVATRILGDLLFENLG